MPRTWTPEQRAAAAERIHQNKPWEKSTGPRTRRGKKKSSRNAVKHGNETIKNRQIRKAFRLQQEFLSHIQCVLAKEKLENRMLHMQTNYIKPSAETTH